jgi:hypothetical protein
MMKTLGISMTLLALGVLVLGTDWSGVEVAPGVWADRPSLTRWAWLGLGVCAVGVVAGPHLQTWPLRLGCLLPLLLWYAWQLRHGTLWPIALLVYGGATTLLWLAACLTPALWQRRAPRAPH